MAALMVGLAMGAGLGRGHAHGVPEAAALRCALQAAPQGTSGQPVPLRFTLTHTGAAPLLVLRWNTPFEGAWLAPFVAVTRDGGRALAYQGATMKRADPQVADYLRLEPGQSVNAELDLALAFDLARPGRYRVQPRLRLLDVVAPATGTRAPRPRAQHQGADLDCAPVGFTLVRR